MDLNSGITISKEKGLDGTERAESVPKFLRNQRIDIFAYMQEGFVYPRYFLEAQSGSSVTSAEEDTKDR